MHRREMLAASSAALLGLSTFPFGWTTAAERRRQKLLYFTRSVEFEHTVVAPGADGLSHSDKILMELGKQAGFDVECTKDGRVFDGDLTGYDAIVFYSCGNLFLPSMRKAPPMSPAGRERLVEAVRQGKPFVGLHSSCYWGRDSAPDDPYLQMVGAKFISHGAVAAARVCVRGGRR